MAKMYITVEQAKALLENRNLNKDKNRRLYCSNKRVIYSQIHKDHGIVGGRSGTKIKFRLEDPNHPDYRLIKNKRTGIPLDNGLPETPLALPAPTATTADTSVAATTPVGTPVIDTTSNAPAVAVKPRPVAKKAAAAKTAAPKAPAAKKATPVGKSPAKAAPAKKAPTIKPDKAPAVKKAAVKKTTKA